MLLQVVYMIVLPWRAGAVSACSFFFFFFSLSLNIEYSKRLCNNMIAVEREYVDVRHMAKLANCRTYKGRVQKIGNAVSSCVYDCITMEDRCS